MKVYIESIENELIDGSSVEEINYMQGESIINYKVTMKHNMLKGEMRIRNISDKTMNDLKEMIKCEVKESLQEGDDN